MRLCPFCSKDLETVQNGSFIATLVCQGCQEPNHKTIFEETIDNTNGALLSDSFRLNDYYVTRRYQNGNYALNKKIGQNTVINKNVIGYLAERTPIILSKPVVEFGRVLIFDFSDLEKLEQKLNTYALIS